MSQKIRLKNKHTGFLAIVKASVVLAIFLAGYFIGQGHMRGIAPPVAQAQKKQEEKTSISNLSPLASKLKPGVVFIVTSGGGDGGGAEGDIPEDHPDLPPDSEKGVGSGFIIDKDGLILTNNHVVEDAKEVEVLISKGKKFSAKVIGRDPKMDVALIKIDAPQKLSPLKMGDSDKTRTGQWVVAMGNPFGLENNVTVGVISGKGRELPEAPFVDFIQTDAAIYPGNSGGPLVDLGGKVIGINTAVVSGTQLGFSIPINRVKDMLPRLKKGGVVRSGFIGIKMAPVSDLPAGLAEEKGVLIAGIIKGESAEQAGLKKNDVIVRFGNKNVSSTSDLARLVAQATPGSDVKIKIERDKENKIINLRVGESPDDSD